MEEAQQQLLREQAQLQLARDEFEREQLEFQLAVRAADIEAAEAQQAHAAMLQALAAYQAASIDPCAEASEVVQLQQRYVAAKAVFERESGEAEAARRVAAEEQAEAEAARVLKEKEEQDVAAAAAALQQELNEAASAAHAFEQVRDAHCIVWVTAGAHDRGICRRLQRRMPQRMLLLLQLRLWCVGEAQWGEVQTGRGWWRSRRADCSGSWIRGRWWWRWRWK